MTAFEYASSKCSSAIPATCSPASFPKDASVERLPFVSTKTVSILLFEFIIFELRKFKFEILDQKNLRCFFYHARTLGLLQTATKFFQQSRKLFLLIFSQHGSDLRDMLRVLREHRIEKLLPFLCQLHIYHAPIVCIVPTLDETFFFKIVHHACCVATAEEHLLRERADRHRSKVPKALQNGELRRCKPKCTDAFVAVFIEC